MSAAGHGVSRLRPARRAQLLRRVRPLHRAAGTALALGLLALACSEPERPRPNVLVITLDTVRADRLGCYGYARDTTPHLDALARDSVLFREAFATSSFTPPTHASIFTSLYPAEHGLMHWNRHLAAVPTAAELFAAAGYRTGAFTPMPTLLKLGLDRGFQTTHSPPYTSVGQQTILADADAINAVALPWLTGADAAADITGAAADDTDDTSGTAAGPFFAWVHYYDAHRPYARQGAEWSGKFTAHDDPSVGATEEWYQIGPAERTRVGLTPERTALLKDHYDGGLAYLDDRVGRLLDGLRAAGVLDNTLVVVIGDHGEIFDEHEPEWFAHDPYLFDENVHVPFLLRLPGREHAGLRVVDAVSQVDVLPTLLDLAGVPAALRLNGARPDMPPIPVGLSGLSLRPLLDRGHIARQLVFADRIGDDLSGRKGTARPTEAAIKASRDRQRMLRIPTHKLLHYEDRGVFEFFEVGTGSGRAARETADGSASVEDARGAAIEAYVQWRERLRLPGAAYGRYGDLSPEEWELLESLGYTGGTAKPAPGDPARDEPARDDPVPENSHPEKPAAPAGSAAPAPGPAPGGTGPP